MPRGKASPDQCVDLDEIFKVFVVAEYKVKKKNLTILFDWTNVPTPILQRSTVAPNVLPTGFLSTALSYISEQVFSCIFRHSRRDNF